MIQHWEIKAYALATVLLGLWLFLRLLFLWLGERKIWRQVPRHMGSAYNASDAKYRPNVRRV